MFRGVRNVIRLTGIARSYNPINPGSPTGSTCILRFYASKRDKPPDECSGEGKDLPRAASSRLGKAKEICPPEPCEEDRKANESCPPDPCKDDRKAKESCPPDPCEEDKNYTKYLIVGAVLAALGALALYMIKHHEPKKAEKKVKKKASKVLLPTRFPADSSDIPNSVPYLLIGGGTASFSAFRAIKSSDPTAKVLVVSSEPYFPYMRPPLSKEAWFYEGTRDNENVIFKQWNGTERSVFYEPKDFYVECKELLKQENGGVAVARGWKVCKVDVVEKKAYLNDGYAISYDKCLIATGSTPRNLKVFEEASEELQEKVMVYRNLKDFETLHSLVTSGVHHVAIVGGGFLGSELACALARIGKKHGFEVTQIFREAGNMGRVLPEYLSNWTSGKVKAEGVNLVTNSEIDGMKMEGDKVVLHLNPYKEITVDQVVVCVGAVPNTKLAEPSDLELDADMGGYAVNAELMARSNLWIAGDCASFHDVRLGRRRVEHHDHAVVTGRLAGENMTGAGKPYTHQSMFWSDLGPDVGYEAIGIVDSSLPTVGVFCKGTEKDTPKGVVCESDKANRAESEQEAKPVTPATSDFQESGDSEDYSKGIVFYLKDDIIVGILLWNLFNRMSVARQVLKSRAKYEDMNEVSKLFNIHDES